MSEAGEPTVLKLYPLAVSLKGARAGNGDRQVSTSYVEWGEVILQRKFSCLRWRRD